MRPLLEATDTSDTCTNMTDKTSKYRNEKMEGSTLKNSPSCQFGDCSKIYPACKKRFSGAKAFTVTELQELLV